MDVSITLIVNGNRRRVTTDPQRPLLEVLREDLHLTGTKYGCGEGQCRACTVLLDGKPVNSCLTPVERANNKTILTIEGLAQQERLHPVQQAFLEEDAMQCGYCVPGMILRTVALLGETRRPSSAQIADWMNGSLCRCCGYPKIVAAVQRAARAAVQGESDGAAR